MLNAFGVVRVADLAGAQYLGSDGDSTSCLQAIRRLLSWPIRPIDVRLLTSDGNHAFVVTFEREGCVVIKNGFSSGYRGTGPSALADALNLLRVCSIAVDEVEVPRDVMERVAASALTQNDIEMIAAARPVRPIRWHDYIYDVYKGRHNETSVWHSFEHVLPFALIDHRLTDLALDFLSAPDRVLLDGFRRLEDHIRDRTGLTDHGSKLFSQAFSGDESRLTWHRDKSGKDEYIDKGEQIGRAQLFVGAYQAFRNPRAHRTPSTDTSEALSEFLLLNQLFRFEAQAIERPPADSAPKCA